MRRVPKIVWVLLLLAVGFAGGIFYRRVYNPTLEERMDAAAKDLEKGVKNAADRLKK